MNIPENEQNFYQYVKHAHYVVEPGVSNRHTAGQMNILKCVLSTICLVVNLVACYMPYLIIKRRFPKPTLDQRTKLHARMQYTYCLLISFGTGLILGSAVLYAWPLTLLGFLDAATKHKVPKGYRVAELVIGTLILGLYLIERALLVATGRVGSMRDYLPPMDSTTFIFAKPTPSTTPEPPGPRENPQDAQRVARASVVVRPGVRRMSPGPNDGGNYSVVNNTDLARAWQARMEAERNQSFIENKLKARQQQGSVSKQQGGNRQSDELSPTNPDQDNANQPQDGPGGQKSGRFRSRGAHYADNATRVLSLISFLLGACFCPFLQGVGIGFATGPKGVCVLYFTIIVRELFANFILGYQESLKKREVIDRHLHMVITAVVLPIGMNLGMILMESTTGDLHDLMVNTLVTAALFMSIIFHGLAAVGRTVGHNRVLIILCPAVVMIGFFVSTLWEEAMDQAFRDAPFPAPGSWFDVGELASSNSAYHRADQWAQGMLR